MAAEQADAAGRPSANATAKPANAPAYIVPSMPRLRTPARSVYGLADRAVDERGGVAERGRDEVDEERHPAAPRPSASVARMSSVDVGSASAGGGSSRRTRQRLERQRARRPTAAACPGRRRPSGTGSRARARRSCAPTARSPSRSAGRRGRRASSGRPASRRRCRCSRSRGRVPTSAGTGCRRPRSPRRCRRWRRSRARRRSSVRSTRMPANRAACGESPTARIRSPAAVRPSTYHATTMMTRRGGSRGGDASARGAAGSAAARRAMGGDSVMPVRVAPRPLDERLDDEQRDRVQEQGRDDLVDAQARPQQRRHERPRRARERSRRRPSSGSATMRRPALDELPDAGRRHRAHEQLALRRRCSSSRPGRRSRPRCRRRGAASRSTRTSRQRELRGQGRDEVVDVRRRSGRRRR